MMLISRVWSVKTLPAASVSLSPFFRAYALRVVEVEAGTTNTRMGARIIDGMAVAARVRAGIRDEIEMATKSGAPIAPCLAAVQVGEREDSQVYLRMKAKAAAEVGITFTVHRFAETVSERDLVSAIEALNRAPEVHGIIVQLPLPPTVRENQVTAAVAPSKDVDGFHPLNMGRLISSGTALDASAAPYFVPCTPAGIMRLLRETGVELAGANALIVGRSKIVGVPMFHLLLGANATVTVAHRGTCNLAALVGRADILVVAAGCPGLVRGVWLKPGVVVIDVGITAVPDNTRKAGFRWSGDVEYDAALAIASAITPVPGGVGPMTVCMLLENTLRAAQRNASLCVAAKEEQQ